MKIPEDDRSEHVRTMCHKDFRPPLCHVMPSESIPGRNAFHAHLNYHIME